MSDSTKTILAAVITALKADPTLTALVSTRIYTHVPQTAIFPYLKLSISSSPESSMSSPDLIHNLRIQAWDQGADLTTLLDIKAAVINVLDRNSTFQQSEFSGVSTIFYEDDNMTSQLVLEFTIN